MLVPLHIGSDEVTVRREAYRGWRDRRTSPRSLEVVLLQARLGASLQRKKLRDLQTAYLRQEATLQQSQKLATLGRLSAGMAHELNNPAAAVQRGAEQLQATFSSLQQAYLRLGRLNLTDWQIESLLALDKLAQERAKQPAYLDSLTRSDREYELEAGLEERGVREPWEVAPGLVSLGFGPGELTKLAADFTSSQFPAVIHWLNCAYVI